MRDDTPDLLAYLQSEAERARDTSLDDQRAVALDYYNGEPFGDELEGRSQLVTRDVAEVVDQQVIEVLRTMVSGDHVVEFDGEGEDGEDFGQHATEAVQYQFMRKQNGYRVLHDSLKAGLLEKTGIVKSWVQRKFKIETGEVPVDMLLEVQANPEFGEVLAAEPIDELDEFEGLWKVRVRVEQPPQFRDMAVPNEEFRIAPDARSLDDSAYIAHVTEKSLSELIEMGFPLDKVNELWGDNPSSTTLANARDVDSTSREVARPGNQRRVWLYEEYVRYDANDDGYDELLCVHRIGTTILSVEEVEEQPFSGWTPFPMQHRFIGQSSADKTMDIQRTRSVMLRQYMDSTYLATSPRLAVDVASMTEDTISDLLTVRPGALVRYKGTPPVPLPIPNVGQSALEAMEMMTAERESRTGITRHNQGLNPDTLNKTASGMAMLQQAGDQVGEYIARNFAEDLVAPMFAKRYRLMRKFGQPFSMKIDGTRVEIDPRTWPEEIDMLINVGLGTGRKDQRLAYRVQLLDFQKEAYAAGSPLVNEDKIFNNVRGMIKDASLGSPSDYLVDPETLKDPETGEMPPRPDPQAAQAEAQAALEAQKLAGEQAEQERQAQIKMRSVEIDGEIRTIAAQADAETKRASAALDAKLRRDKAAEEARLAQDKMIFEMGLAEERFEFEKTLRQTSADDSGVDGFRPGGDLAE
jgi:hypothetical protein